MDEQLQHDGNGIAPVKRARGRPRKPVVPIEAFSDDQFREAMVEADAIERTRTLQQLVAEHEAAGLHPAAFRTCRKLVKAGPQGGAGVLCRARALSVRGGHARVGRAGAQSA
jgi:hypothetical protein